MEDRKRTWFAVIIAVVVLAAVLYSFGLNLFSSHPPLILADPEASSEQRPGDDPSVEQGGIPVEITTATVQRVIADLSRYTSYSRAVVVTYYWGDSGVGTSVSDVWVNGGWTRTETTLATGTVEHSIVNGEQIWLWYDDDSQVFHGAADGAAGDLMQHVLTYEDVLALDPGEIARAAYVELDGESCIFVEARQARLGSLNRYWISVTSGLLLAAEKLEDGRTVYSMASQELVSPLTDRQGLFTLPDGTDLLQVHPNQAGAEDPE